MQTIAAVGVSKDKDSQRITHTEEKEYFVLKYEIQHRLQAIAVY
jgi:hypothetical protein